MPALRKFFCLQLETGVLCIGILGILGSLVKYYDSTNPTYRPGPIETLVYILICALLIFGTIKRNHYYLLPWLILTYIGIIVTSLVILTIIVLSFINYEEMQRAVEKNIGTYNSSQNTFLIFFSLLIAVYALMIYMYMAVSSLFSTFKKENPRLPGAILPQTIGESVTFRKV